MRCRHRDICSLGTCGVCSKGGWDVIPQIILARVSVIIIIIPLFLLILLLFLFLYLLFISHPTSPSPSPSTAHPIGLPPPTKIIVLTVFDGRSF
jgi:hypothetical protein